MMEGLDATYAKLVLFGYHAGIGEAGMMDHTYSLSSLFQAKANGVVLDEALINAYYAGTYDVPLCFVFGDQTCVDRLRPLAGGADYLPSKKAVSRFSGEMVPYNELLASLKAKGKALKDVQGQVLALKGRIKAEFTMTDTLRAYLAAMVPGVSLKEPRKIGFKASDFREFYRYLQTIVTVCASAKSL
jgi:D-amino peptidase